MTNIFNQLSSHIPTTLLYFPKYSCQHSLGFSQFSLDFFRLSRLLTPTLQGIYINNARDFPKNILDAWETNSPEFVYAPTKGNTPPKKHLTNPLPKTFCNAHTRDIRHLKQKKCVQLVHSACTPRLNYLTLQQNH